MRVSLRLMVVRILAMALVVASLWGAPARAQFVDLPDPAIVGSTPPFDANWVVSFVFDSAPNTDYASLGGGVGTFINFDFGVPTYVTRVIFTDRLSSGGANGSGAMGAEDNVTAFMLTFSNDLVFGDPDDVVVSATSPPCCDTVPVDIPSGVKRRYVRWDVTGIAGSSNNDGASDFLFQTAPPNTAPTASSVGLIMLVVALIAVAVFTLRRRPGPTG